MIMLKMLRFNIKILSNKMFSEWKGDLLAEGGYLHNIIQNVFLVPPHR